MKTILLSMISGDALVKAIITLVVVGLIFWLLLWLIGYCGVPEPFAKVAKVLLALAAVIFCINALLSMAGHPMIQW